MEEEIENSINEFRDFLDGIMPDNFDRSSAYAVTRPGYKGPDGFEAFTRKHIRDAEHEYEENEGNVSPLIWLANDEEERAFEAYHDETIQDMFDRIQREATSMKATMTLVAMIMHAANSKLDVDGTDPESVRAAIDSGDLELSYGWYAERQGTPPDRRGGLWHFNDDFTLGPRTDGNPANAPLFHSILDK